MASLGTALAWQTEPSATPNTEMAVAQDGAVIFRVKGCASCHTGPETTALTGERYPNLTDASAWAGDRHPEQTAEQYLAASIREPWAFISPAFTPSGGSGSAMPQLGLSDTEVAAVVNYLLAG